MNVSWAINQLVQFCVLQMLQGPRFLCRHPGLLFMCVFRLPSGDAFVLVIEPSRTPMQIVPALRQGRFLLLSQCSLGWHSPVQHPGSLGNLILQGENIKRGDTSSTKLEQDQRWVKIALILKTLQCLIGVASFKLNCIFRWTMDWVSPFVTSDLKSALCALLTTPIHHSNFNMPFNAN